MSVELEIRIFCKFCKISKLKILSNSLVNLVNWQFLYSFEQVSIVDIEQANVSWVGIAAYKKMKFSIKDFFSECDQIRFIVNNRNSFSTLQKLCVST